MTVLTLDDLSRAIANRIGISIEEAKKLFKVERKWLNRLESKLRKSGYEVQSDVCFCVDPAEIIEREEFETMILFSNKRRHDVRGRTLFENLSIRYPGRIMLLKIG